MQLLACKFLLLLSVSVFSVSGHADYVVIAHPSMNAVLSPQDVERLFLAKTKALPDGQAAAPVNHKEGSEIRVNFDRRVNGKNESQMKSYWAKLIFTGKAVPIRQLDSDEDVIAFVSGHPGAIGYINASNVNNSVKVLFSF